MPREGGSLLHSSFPSLALRAHKSLALQVAKKESGLNDKVCTPLKQQQQIAVIPQEQMTLSA